MTQRKTERARKGDHLPEEDKGEEGGADRRGKKEIK